jgi:hypothetical protein
MLRFTSLASLALLLSACPNSSDEGAACVRDEDCAELCSRVNECLSADSAIEVRLSWTVSGLTPSPSNAGVCGVIEALEVRFESDSLRDEPIIYYPVPCELGRVYYDKMPDSIGVLQVTAIGGDDAVIDVAIRNIESRSSDFVVDFNP